MTVIQHFDRHSLTTDAYTVNLGCKRRGSRIIGRESCWGGIRSHNGKFGTTITFSPESRR